MRTILVLFFVSILCSCDLPKKEQKEQISREAIFIEPFNAVNETARKGEIRPPVRPGRDSSIVQSFVTNIEILDAGTLSYLDSVSCSLLGKKVRKFDHHSITFYHKSEFTNNEYLLAHPRTLARHSQIEDLLVSYWWSQDCRNGLREIYKKGMVVKTGYIDCDCD